MCSLLHCLRTIRRFADGGDPFFVHVCYTAPHFPLHAKPEDITRYKGRYKQGYFRLREQRYERQLKLGILDPRWKLSPVDHQLGPFRYDYEITPWEQLEDQALEQRRMEVYAAMVDCLDQGVGRILDTLEEAGVAQDTLVLFLSDNGGCASYPPYSDKEARAGHAAYNKNPPGGVDTYDFCGPGWGWAQCAPFRRYKVWTYEGGIATPCIARWPGVIKAGSLTPQVGHVVDLMPTLVELSGAAYPRQREANAVLATEGLSLLPVLRGEQRAGHETLCWYLYGNRAVRQGRWKLVWGVTAGQWELYDMRDDRTETTNLAERYPQRVAGLKEAWHEWAERTEVPLEDQGL